MGGFTELAVGSGLAAGIVRGAVIRVVREGRARVLECRVIENRADRLLIDRKPRGIDRLSPLVRALRDKVVVRMTVHEPAAACAVSGSAVTARGCARDDVAYRGDFGSLTLSGFEAGGGLAGGDVRGQAGGRRALRQVCRGGAGLVRCRRFSQPGRGGRRTAIRCAPGSPGRVWRRDREKLGRRHEGASRTTRAGAGELACRGFCTPEPPQSISTRMKGAARRDQPRAAISVPAAWAEAQAQWKL